MPYERVGTEIIHEGPRIRLERVELRNVDTGATHTREIGHHPGAVCVLPFIDDDTIVLIRQRRWAVGQELIELPAGTLEPGEAPINAAGRELLEEAGFVAGRLTRVSAFFTAPGLWDERMYAFAATELSRSIQRLEEGEEIVRLVVTFDEALQMIRSGDIIDAKTICTLLHYDRFVRGAPDTPDDDAPISLD